jgi:hypothetical protein
VARRDGHESFFREETPKSSSDRGFGLLFAGVFLAIAVAPLLGDGAIHIWALGFAFAFLSLGLFRPGMLAPLNRLWNRFGLLLHRIVSPIVLAAIYILAIIPTALVMRAIGLDSMHRRFEPDAKSYWITRDPASSDSSSMKRQF